uniref:Autophagy related 2B n=1 Tax=Salmo trutta TaxID=8032 RepID=A0A673XHU7_SALTR
MPWPFSESIKKRACRYLLHRYLGNFLQEKLSLDQLSLDLYQGTGSLAQVPLDKWSLNEILESVDAPFEVIEGFIQTISLTVPWASLLQENCALEVKGLEMVFRPRPRMASGMEPMYWSSFMTSSMQLAKECLSQRLTDDLGESFQPLEGLEKFAETIETVLRRVKVTFLDTVLRIEHVPENSKTGIALEMRINKIVYCDETGEESSSVNVHQPTTFAHKNLQLEGVTVFWDEFSEHRYSLALPFSPHPQFTEPVSSATPFEPMQIGHLSGRIDLSLVLKQNQTMPGAKLDVDGQISTMIMLLSPRQVHLLLDMFGVFSGSGGFNDSECLQVSNSLILSCVSAHPTKAHGDESRPELVFRLTLGSLAVCVLHIDPLPPPDAAPSPLAPMAADFFRVVCSDQLPPGMKVTYEHCQGSSLHSFSTDVSLGQMELLECLFPSEAQRGVSLRGVQYTEVKASPPTTSTHKAFTEVFLDDSRTPANTHVSIRVNAPVLSLVVRFPIPDLRSDQERGPWFKKSLQKEVLYLELEDLEVKTEFTGGSSPEQTKMELTFRELVGMYVTQLLTYRLASKPEPLLIYISFLYSFFIHSHREVPGTGGPAYVVKLSLLTLQSGAESQPHRCPLHPGPEPSPFSSRRVMYENEEMVIPGDVAEMTEFQEKTMSNSRFILELCLPNVQLSLPNKAFYEKLHNRYYAQKTGETNQIGSEEETMHHYSPASEQCFRSRRKKKPKAQSKTSQSLFSVILTVNHGLVALQTSAKQEDKTILNNRHGEFWLEVKNGVLFSVTQYEGYKDRHYICFHTSNICLYHQGLVEGDTPVSDIKLPCRTRPHWLEPAIYPSETDRASPSEGIGLEDHSMLSVAVKISSQNMERNVKEFLVAVGVRGTTLQHRVVPPKLGWYDQIVDFLNVSDEPVLGYIPPASVTTLHLHLWSCSLDYRPLYLPLRSLLVVETFSISSSVSLDHSSSTLRYRSFWMKQRCSSLTRVRQTLVKYYVQVVDMGTLELRITAVKPGVDGELTEPRFELRCSSDVIHIRTCSDSCAALMNLIQYVASYGDLVPPPGPEAKSTRPPSQAPPLPDAEQQICLSDFTLSLLSPTGIHEEQNHDLDQPRSDLFLFPDESGNLPQELSPTYPTLHSPLITPAPSLVPETDDFCILETPGSRADVRDRDEEPLVNKLIPDSIEIKDDHFGLPLDSSDSSRGALNFPVPELRYLIREISVIWHLYGGKDFGSSTFTSSPARSWGCTPHSSPSQTPVRQSRGGGRAGGGRGRNPDVLMEIQLSKVRFQHEVYPQAPVASGSAADQPVSRQVLIVQDLEIRDRLATSQMNKFLYLYSSKEMPRTAHSNMLTVRALHMCPETGQAPQECCLRVSLMPLRLNIDQDALFFLKDFFASLAAEVEMFSPPDQEGKISLARVSTLCLLMLLGNYEIFVFICLISLREFRFTSEVPIRLDYHGKHVSMEQGTFAGIVIGLTQLNCSELKLRRLCYRQGLLGVDKLFSYAINEWLNDIKKNQLPGLLGGVGPIHSLVQLVQGFRDLVWLPIEQYRKDGRVVRGLQRGTASFGTSTAMAALELTNRMVRTIQAAAETAYDMVSPGSDEREMKRIKRFSHYRFAHQPVDLREGVANAYSVVKEGITDTALTIYDTATREHEQRGMTGAVGGVLRQLPPAVVKPLIMATEATSNVLGGMRNQIHPDARQEESQKWRQGEE